MQLTCPRKRRACQSLVARRRLAAGSLIAEVAIQTAQNSLCTAGPASSPPQSPAPFACCTGTGTGNCQNASNATLVAPAAQNGTGWTLEDSQTCGTDLQEAIYYRYVQPGDSGAIAFTWSFSNATNSNFLGVARISMFYGVGTTPIESELAQCTLASSTLTAPSITISSPNSLSVVMYGPAAGRNRRQRSGSRMPHLAERGHRRGQLLVLAAGSDPVADTVADTDTAPRRQPDANAKSDTDADPDTDANADADPYADADTYSDTDPLRRRRLRRRRRLLQRRRLLRRRPHADADAYSDANPDAYSDPDADPNSDADAYSGSGGRVGRGLLRYDQRRRPLS